MKLKILNWIVLAALLIIVLWALFSIEIWAKDWQDLFYYQDNWVMLAFVVIMVLAAGTAIRTLFRESFRALK
jgi:uncharacterized membrane protein YcjF (UPF0283 family)